MHSRFLWLKNEGRLTVVQSATIDAITRLNLKTARALRIRLAAELILDRWCSWAIRSRLETIKKARTVKRHRDGILR